MHVAEAGFKFLILLPPPLKCWALHLDILRHNSFQNNACFFMILLIRMFEENAKDNELEAGDWLLVDWLPLAGLYSCTLTLSSQILQK